MGFIRLDDQYIDNLASNQRKDCVTFLCNWIHLANDQHFSWCINRPKERWQRSLYGFNILHSLVYDSLCSYYFSRVTQSRFWTIFYVNGKYRLRVWLIIIKKNNSDFIYYCFSLRDERQLYFYIYKRNGICGIFKYPKASIPSPPFSVEFLVFGTKENDSRIKCSVGTFFSISPRLMFNCSCVFTLSGSWQLNMDIAAKSGIIVSLLVKSTRGYFWIFLCLN